MILFALLAFAADLDTICKKSTFTEAGMREKIISQIMRDPNLRPGFGDYLKKESACRSAVKNYVGLLLKGDAVAHKEETKYTFVTLGLNAQIPEAQEFVKQELAQGARPEWIEALKQTQQDVYQEFLVSWVKSEAESLRAQMTASGMEGEVKPINTIILERFLTEHQNFTVEELKALNAILGTQSAQVRSLFVDRLVPIFQKQFAVWIQTVLQEPGWLQVRLFPLIQKLKGPEIVKKLLELSATHTDPRIRSLAGRTLEDMVNRK